MTGPPDGIGPGAPFDVAAFFAAPPPELNAAPLYLDALFEFGPELAVCFPNGRGDGPKEDDRRAEEPVHR